MKISTKEIRERDDMNSILKRIKTNSIISALLYVLLGLALLVKPELSTTVLCTALGVVLILHGAADILDFVFHRDGSLYYALRLVAGIVLTVVGVWLVAQPTLIAVVVPRIIGVLILFHGCKDLGDALTLRKNKSSRALAAMLLGVITIALGALLVVNPFSAFATVVRIIGAVLIYDGVSDIWITTEVSKAIKLTDKELQGQVIDVDYQDVSGGETKDGAEDNPFQDL